MSDLHPDSFWPHGLHAGDYAVIQSSGGGGFVYSWQGWFQLHSIYVCNHWFAVVFIVAEFPHVHSSTPTRREDGWMVLSLCQAGTRVVASYFLLTLLLLLLPQVSFTRSVYTLFSTQLCVRYRIFMWTVPRPTTLSTLCVVAVILIPRSAV